MHILRAPAHGPHPPGTAGTAAVTPGTATLGRQQGRRVAEEKELEGARQVRQADAQRRSLELAEGFVGQPPGELINSPHRMSIDHGASAWKRKQTRTNKEEKNKRGFREGGMRLFRAEKMSSQTGRGLYLLQLQRCVRLPAREAREAHEQECCEDLDKSVARSNGVRSPLLGMGAKMPTRQRQQGRHKTTNHPHPHKL